MVILKTIKLLLMLFALIDLNVNYYAVYLHKFSTLCMTNTSKWKFYLDKVMLYRACIVCFIMFILMFSTCPPWQRQRLGCDRESSLSLHKFRCNILEERCTALLSKIAVTAYPGIFIYENVFADFRGF